jgi:uncharacterized BrkB/YihY/UPF0761 family membrane protein
MNEYKKIIWKRNILSIIIAIGVLLGVVAGLILIAFIGSLLGDYLPFLLVFSFLCVFVYVISLQVRLILKERDDERLRLEYRKREIQRRENK